MNNGNWLDRTIGWFSPARYAERLKHRQVAKLCTSYGGAGYNSYNSAYASRLSEGINTTEWNLGYVKEQQKQYEIQSLIARARNLERNNSIAGGLLDRDTDNVIGSGFKLQVLSSDPEWNKRAEEQLTNDFDKVDISGLPFSEHQRLLYRSYKRDGDVGVILRQDGKVQPIEAHLISSPNQVDIQESNIICGVEFDATGKATRYHILSNWDSKRKWEPVNAEDFILIPRLNRLTQVRGESVFTTTFDLYEQIDGWVEAVIVASRISACYGLVHKQEHNKQFLSQLPVSPGQSNGQQRKQTQLAPGMEIWLNPGEDISTISPSQPAGSFPEQLKAFLRLIGLPFSMPLELVLLDFSNVNYSSARASLQTAYRSFRNQQRFFSDRYLSRLYRWKISKLMKEGKLPPKDLYDAFKHRWIPEKWAYLDPVKELLAQQMGLDMGLDTITSALITTGQDVEELFAKRSAELQQMRLLGIPIYHAASLQQITDTVVTPENSPLLSNPELIGTDSITESD